MEFLINPYRLQERNKSICKTMNGLNAKPALNKGKGFDKNIVRGEQAPLITSDGLPGRNHIRVAWFVTVQQSEQRRCIDEQTHDSYASSRYRS